MHPSKNNLVSGHEYYTVNILLRIYRDNKPSLSLKANIELAQLNQFTEHFGRASRSNRKVKRSIAIMRLIRSRFKEEEINHRN